MHSPCIRCRHVRPIRFPLETTGSVVGPVRLALQRLDSRCHPLSSYEFLVDAKESEKVSWDQILNWLELTCWVVLVLWPVLLRMNGRSVSRDQAVFRWAILAVAALGSFGLRGYRILRRRVFENSETTKPR